MKGQILDFSIQSNSGVISGDDQNRYHFTGASWRGQISPARGQKVDFTVDGTGQANDIYVYSRITDCRSSYCSNRHRHP